MQIYNSLTRQKETFATITPDVVNMYVCGITVYDLCHIGHARGAIVFDMVRKWLEHSGYQVNFVRNITDIDDKIIARAVTNGESIKSLTDRMIVAMNEDMASVGVVKPTREPRATDHIPAMLSMIDQMVDSGNACVDVDAVKFNTSKFRNYGQLSGRTTSDDFVLWKFAKSHEPDEVKYQSKYGVGRPGWHIECSAMCKSALGETIDIHGGGLDLQFPHHDNEIAQSETVSGKPLANCWMHNGFMTVDCKKMSKSEGNFTTIKDALKIVSGEVLRFWILQTHYRSPIDYTVANVLSAKSAYQKLANVAKRGEFSWSHPYAVEFSKEMDNDFSTSNAIAVLFKIVDEYHQTWDESLPALLHGLGGSLGLFWESNVDSEWIDAIISKRNDAKLLKDYKLADTIRAELLEAGVSIMDTKSGTTWSIVK